MLVGLAVSGVLETIGILSVLPLLEYILVDDSRSPISEMIRSFAVEFNVPDSPYSILAVLMIIFGLKAFIHLKVLRYISFATSRIAFEQREEMFQHLSAARWRFFTDKPLGQFVNTALFEASKAGACFMALCKLAESSFKTFLLLVAAALTSWQVSALAIFVGFVLIKILASVVKISQRTGLETSEANKELSKNMLEIVQYIKPLKAMKLEERIFLGVRGPSEVLSLSFARQLFAKYTLPILSEPIILSFILGGLIVLTTLGIQFAQLLVLAALFYRALTSWGVIQQTLQTLGTNENFFWSFQNFLHNALEQKERSCGSGEPKFEQSISFHKVNFGYSRDLVLSNATFSIRARGLTTIKGASGIGKTSIADLICHLHANYDGCIKVDDVDLHSIDITLWRGLIGYVTQESFVLNESLRVNITLWDSSINDEEIWDALSKAGAVEFVRRLPDALESSLGERGLTLSGGQRQRIALARALARKPKLLIVDEITASLDPVTEYQICQTLRELSRDIAVLAISHQSAITEASDRIYEVIPVNDEDTGNVRSFQTHRDAR
ncbi:MAG: ABC transporter ATP-binding protein [Emcibacteraceae bacterium]|nr:ABC transporter ATP-binding protein [Emcibacteraceae bacterium]